MRHNKAEEENSLLIFLVECCDEAPGLEVTGKDVADAYVKFYQAGNRAAYAGNRLASVSYLADYTIYKLLSQAGFTKETRVQQGPKGGQYKVVFFIGLGLKSKNELLMTNTVSCYVPIR